MAKLHVKKVRSAINRTARQKKTLQALGLHKMNQVVEHNDSPAVMGMIAKVSHLVTVEKA
ncbi:LSU ribosomal protein L30P [Nonlabens sp. Hel1_33_55]|uniref:50S ribosomal protein L30 n=1 Tax=Nonlabens sp. Hel1_33_55 TaxID=1336802 RepID=UPI000875EC36|nr:50S ribosomal protein L30 [Nonlabens sp. Hel1_33_55]SCY21518.1 LSU ribosomal protein L30P [Nonlabens sp. Hel1_33_55]